MKLRAWLRALCLLAVGWLLYGHADELRSLPHTLAQGDATWIVGAILLQVGYYRLYASLYQAVFETVGVPSGTSALIPVVLSAMFADVAFPAFGLSGAAVLMDDAVQRGRSAARAFAGILLVRLCDFCTFAVLAASGLLYLVSHQSLQPYEVAAAAALLGFLITAAAALVLAVGRPRRLQGMLDAAADLLNAAAARWLQHKDMISHQSVQRGTDEFCEAAHAIAAGWRRLPYTLTLALAAHLANAISLYLLFLAFRQPISLAPMLAGLAIAYLLMTVDASLPGSGVVEASMTAAYYAMGIPLDAATVVALSYRGLSFWMPVAVGFLLMRQSPDYGHHARSRAEFWSVRAVAFTTALMGMVNLVSSLRPAYHYRLTALRDLVGVSVPHQARLAAAVSGFALLLLAGNLWRRKRTAWMLAMAALLVSVYSHLLKGLDYEAAILAAAVALWLWKLRPQFHARSDPPSVWRGVRVLAEVLILTTAYGTLGFYMLDRHFHTPFSLGAAVSQTVMMAIALQDPGVLPQTTLARYFLSSIYLVGAGSTCYALWMLFTPVLMSRSPDAAVAARAEQIVSAHGCTSMARFCLFDDKLHWFSPGGSLLAYVVKGHVAVVLGDPIGPEADVDAALDGFIRFAEDNDWDVAFYQVMPHYLESYRKLGFHVLHVGDEAIVDLAAFTLAGGTSKSLRTVMNRLNKAGFRAQVHDPPVTSGVLLELEGISNEWLTLVKGTEKKFSLGAFEPAYVASCPVIAIYTPQGVISAFANLVAEYRKNELTADLMRRRTEIENGTMDFLFGSLFQWAKEKGYGSFNMGLSPLAGVGEQTTDPLQEKALHYVYEHLNQFYNFKGLHAFKEKFHPTWSPRYLIYPSPALLGPVSLALMRAHSGDDFVWDFVRDLAAVQMRRLRSPKQ